MRKEVSDHWMISDDVVARSDDPSVLCIKVLLESWNEMNR